MAICDSTDGTEDQNKIDTKNIQVPHDVIHRLYL